MNISASRIIAYFFVRVLSSAIYLKHSSTFSDEKPCAVSQSAKRLSSLVVISSSCISILPPAVDFEGSRSCYLYDKRRSLNLQYFISNKIRNEQHKLMKCCDNLFMFADFLGSLAYGAVDGTKSEPEAPASGPCPLRDFTRWSSEK